MNAISLCRDEERAVLGVVGGGLECYRARGRGLPTRTGLMQPSSTKSHFPHLLYRPTCIFIRLLQRTCCIG